jgi:hypothetical protein
VKLTVVGEALDAVEDLLCGDDAREHIERGGLARVELDVASELGCC